MVTAGEMAKRLRQLCSLLISEGVIEAGSVNSIEKVVARLQGQRALPAWRYSVTRSDPIRFCSTATKKVDCVTPVLQAKLEMVDDDSGGMKGKFFELNTTLEFYSDERLLDRWHVDLANDDQAGPVFHLQHGGHSAGGDRRDLESKLSEPRWHHPPMDLILACELVVANFYHDKWLSLRKNPVWTALVRDAETFCYASYFQATQNWLHSVDRAESLLQKFWVA